MNNKNTVEKDPLSIDELIRQAKEVLIRQKQEEKERKRDLERARKRY